MKKSKKANILIERFVFPCYTTYIEYLSPFTFKKKRGIIMKIKKTDSSNKEKRTEKNIIESGLIVVSNGEEMGIYRFADAAQRKKILKENAENKCKEFKNSEILKAEEYLQRALDEAEARKYPLGYIAVRSGQFKGIYSYIDSDERLKHMNKYHKYEIRDFPHFHFRASAEEWIGNSPVIEAMPGNDEISILINTELGYHMNRIEKKKENECTVRNKHDYDAAMKFISGEVSRPHVNCHEHLEKIYESGSSGTFRGKITSIESNNIVFKELEILCTSDTLCEHDICIYNVNNTFNFKQGQTVSFSAEVYEYITERGYIDYGIYELFDVSISSV